MSKVDLKYHCPLNLNDLISDETGNFHCATCSKNVIDFRNSDNVELSNGECGIFKTSQINRVHRKGHLMRLGIALPLITILGISSPSEVNGQTGERIEQTIPNKIRIEGIVKDKETGNPIPFVHIIITQGDVEVLSLTSDKEGKFIIELDSSDYEISNLQVKFSSVGYHDVNSGIVHNSQEVILDIARDSEVIMDSGSIVFGKAIAVPPRQPCKVNPGEEYSDDIKWRSPIFRRSE